MTAAVASRVDAVVETRRFRLHGPGRARLAAAGLAGVGAGAAVVAWRRSL